MPLVVSELCLDQAKKLFPEREDLLQIAETSSIVWDEGASPANWSWDTKEIKLHPTLEKDPEKLLFFLLFELCNAARTSEFKAIKATNVEDFVEAVERVEYASSLEATRILGSRRFPQFDSFEHHYLYQQLQGHSERIAKENFPHLEYHGSISSLSKQEKAVLLACLQCQLKGDKERFSQFHLYLPEQFKHLQFS
ncbi:MAG: hypothetical protein H7A38_03725 [Chlamydiales bacterium]|nr:hypothetical protein [Chlamydiales bacterium]